MAPTTPPKHEGAEPMVADARNGNAKTDTRVAGGGPGAPSPTGEEPKTDGAKKAATSAKEPRSKQRQQAIQSALGQIEKQFGKGSIMTLGGNTRIQIEGISTGSLSLDVALGGYG